MTRIVYNKIVRDKIPEIIAKQGKICEVRMLPAGEHLADLNAKLAEELAEYSASGNVMELADMVEIIRAIVRLKGLTHGEFEALREKKRESNGGFEKGLLLLSVEEPE
jgi:predicted house-cleaning noncanonical NTP pyrophosphatase (MazG superfamily)